MWLRVEIYESTGIITLLAQSDPTEVDLTSLLEQYHYWSLALYEDVGRFSQSVWAIFPVVETI